MYTVVLEGGRRVSASLRGRLKRGRSPVVVGDRVTVSHDDVAWTIESVEPRASELVRRGRGGRAPKVLAANLDRVFVVVAVADPPASPELVDRLLAMVEASDIRPVLVLNKVDLPGAATHAERFVRLYEPVGYRTLVVSARTAVGLGALRAMLCEGTSALIGPSGVGKSSILNALDPGLELRTGELSGKTGTGRHTTVSSRLMSLDCGGAVADTPGLGDIALWGVEPRDLASCFPEIAEPSAACRFRSCTHLGEPGCAVREALDDGRIEKSRYRSYTKLRAEAEEALER